MSRKKINKGSRDAAEISQPAQMSLFYLADPNEGEFSNTIELYDALPKYVWSERREHENIDTGVITRTFKAQGAEYKVKLKPALIEKISDQGSRTVLIYPGAREEIIEEALRKLAVQGHAREINGEAGVFFTVSQLRKELSRTNHTYSVDEIMESLDVMSSSQLECSRGTNENGQDSFRGNFLTSLYLSTRQDYLKEGNDAKCFATFHPLVTHGINNQRFRMYSYQISMKIKSDLARYMYKRMSHYWKQASPEHPYQFKLVTFISSSPRGLSEKMKDNMRAMRNALKVLVQHKIICPEYIEERIKDPSDGRVTLDVQYRLYPDPKFVSQVKRANRSQADIKKITDMEQVK